MKEGKTIYFATMTWPVPYQTKRQFLRYDVAESPIGLITDIHGLYLGK